MKFAGLAAAIAVTAICICAPAAGAKTIKVETKKDEFGAGGTPKCALREAVQAANTDSGFGGCAKGSNADSIVLGKGAYSLSIAGTGEDANADGDIDLDSAIKITGKGMGATVIDGNGSTIEERVLHQLGGRLTLSALTVRDGNAGDSGGGLYIDGGTSTVVKKARFAHNYAYNSGGAIYAGTGSPTKVQILSSQAVENDAYDYGGGISANFEGDLIVKDSLVAGNTGDYGPGGIQAQQSGRFTLLNSRVVENHGGEYGGGIEIDGGSTLIKRSTISNNTVAENGYYGGGIFDEGNDGVARIVDSTIAANSSDGYGGGLYLGYGTWKISNSTISRNSSGYDYGYGGGIYNDGADVSITSSTITQNVAYSGYGGIENNFGTMEFESTILADNRDYYYRTDYDCSGATSLGNNLIGDGSCDAVASDEVGDSGDDPLDPKLAPLGSYGGPTRTHALLPGSRAINRGGEGCPRRDQRGKGRKGRCDIGSYELGGK